MALKFVKTIEEGGMLPRFYGIAWWTFYQRRAVCMPVPFNMVARVLRDGWQYMLAPSMVPMNPRDAYNAGYAAGRASTFDNMASMGVELNQRERRERSCD